MPFFTQRPVLGGGTAELQAWHISSATAAGGSSSSTSTPFSCCWLIAATAPHAWVSVRSRYNVDVIGARTFAPGNLVGTLSLIAPKLRKVQGATLLIVLDAHCQMSCGEMITLRLGGT